MTTCSLSSLTNLQKTIFKAPSREWDNSLWMRIKRSDFTETRVVYIFSVKISALITVMKVAYGVCQWLGSGHLLDLGLRLTHSVRTASFCHRKTLKIAFSTSTLLIFTHPFLSFIRPGFCRNIIERKMRAEILNLPNRVPLQCQN